MAFERTWESIPNRLFIADGQANGVVTLSSTKDFRVKQYVIVDSTLVDSIKLEIKRVISSTQLILGEVGKPISNRFNLSSYLLADGAFLYAPEQPKNRIPKDDQANSTFEREPVIARRVFNVDEHGAPFNDVNPFPVSAPIAVRDLTIPKFSYSNNFSLEYIGEAKIGQADSANSHFIQKFLYDSGFNLTRIVIATDVTDCNCTDVTILVITPSTVATMSTTTGDFTEASIGDGFTLTTPTQTITGSITQVLSPTSVSITLSTSTPSLVNETTAIAVSDLLITLNHSSTSGYENKRWDHRTRYVYATL